TNRSPMPRWPTALSTGWFTTRIALRCAAIRCARIGGSRAHSEVNIPPLPSRLSRDGPPPHPTGEILTTLSSPLRVSLIIKTEYSEEQRWQDLQSLNRRFPSRTP